ncbi:unnamed protein product [Lepeophtheirus salmonis]|uniref:(salmon louse) hypothetical protein n=1 Tax=Lepeophtheirus salmonis TaxID=72036 RepID=A0A7R8H2J0_LEPSM|nr:unnamed protein product [Lepeophtheirus salmonis]CAF2815022.1 unnamed protein product [Lepeophtheirus salmonis]
MFKEFHKYVIGKGGTTVRKIRAETETRVDIPVPGSDSDVITLTGRKSNVEKAYQLLLKLQSEIENIIVSEVAIPPKIHNTEYPWFFPPFDSGSDKVVIRGPKEDVEKAKKMLLDLSSEKTIKAGVNIQGIRDRTGTKEAVAAAKKELEKKVKDLDNVVEDSMIVEPKFHRYLLLEGVNDKVTLKGAKDCVEAARNRINEIVMDLESEVTIECAIPQAHHRTVMGPRGSKIQKSENCVEAAEALKQLVPITIQVDVPFEFHRYVIGQKGTGVRQLMSDNDVNIIVPPSDKHSDCITVVGTLVNVEKARESIRQRVEEFEKEKLDKMLKSFEIIINIKPEFHPKIIGRKGSVIQQLRSEHDVNIQLPKKDSSECDVITITGYEDRVNMAKDAILKIEDAELVYEKLCQISGLILSYPVTVMCDRNQVVVIGKENDVLDCKDHLLNLEEEYLQDIQENDWMEEYIKPVSVDSMPDTPKPSRGFEVAKGAPWHGVSDEAFPTLSGNNGMAVPVAPVTHRRKQCIYFCTNDHGIDREVEEFIGERVCGLCYRFSGGETPQPYQNTKGCANDSELLLFFQEVSFKNLSLFNPFELFKSARNSNCDIRQREFPFAASRYFEYEKVFADYRVALLRLNALLRRIDEHLTNSEIATSMLGVKLFFFKLAIARIEADDLRILTNIAFGGAVCERNESVESSPPGFEPTLPRLTPPYYHHSGETKETCSALRCKESHWNKKFLVKALSQILSEIEPERIAPPQGEISVRGLKLDTCTDELMYDLASKFEKFNHDCASLSRRDIVSLASLIFDTQVGQNFKYKDTEAAKEAVKVFTKWGDQILLMKDLCFPRYNAGSMKGLALFRDASKVGMGVAVYVVVEN